MNNLTPLQEIASRIYAALVTASTYTETDGTVRPEYNTQKLLDYATTEARQLLEATKPEPLEWMETTIKGYANPMHYSNVNEFRIAQTNGGIFIISLTKDLEHALGNFPTLDEAKQFAEHIRTR